MKNSELDQLLKTAPVPDRAPEFWEQLPRHITARLHWQEKRETAPAVERRRFAPLWRARPGWAFGAVAICAVAALAFFALRHPADKPAAPLVGPMAGMEKSFREIESLFPNQVAAIVFDEQAGPRLVLSEKADVPASPPLYLKICGPTGCQRIITFSGQQIRVNGDQWDVLVDGAGNILIAGRQLAWSSASRGRGIGSYRIEARWLETPS